MIRPVGISPYAVSLSRQAAWARREQICRHREAILEGDRAGCLP